jgi:hypothetical protein
MTKAEKTCALLHGCQLSVAQLFSRAPATIPCTDFDFIRHDTSHNHPTYNEKFLILYLTLMYYGFRIHTDTHKRRPFQ